MMPLGCPWPPDPDQAKCLLFSNASDLLFKDRDSQGQLAIELYID